MNNESILPLLVTVLLFHGCTSAEPPITDIVWQWQHTMQAEADELIPGDPEQYTLLLKPDGTLAVRADCNRGGGDYTMNGAELTLNVTHTTMAMCPPESLDDEFLKALARVILARLDDDQLSLELMDPAGTMTFGR